MRPEKRRLVVVGLLLLLVLWSFQRLSRSFAPSSSSSSPSSSSSSSSSSLPALPALPALSSSPYSSSDGGGGKKKKTGAGGEPAPLRIAACVRIKNEGIYIREWLEFHLMVGIEHFYIWDDSSTDATREELAPYVERGVVTLHTKVDHSHDAEHGQNGHRDMCLSPAYNVANATWVAMIDADEFLFPSAGMSLRDHLASPACSSSVAYLMVRWHMFGSNGLRRRPEGLVTEHYRMHNAAPNRERCPPRYMGCFETSPPLSTKLLLQPRCVKKMGTHYVTELRDGAESRGARGCVDIYTPLASKSTRFAGWDRKEERGGGSGGSDGEIHAFAKAMHRSCAAPLHLNHYAVKSREDYLAKFQRGRISRGEKDVKAGLAVRNKTTGQVVLRPLPASATAVFLGDEDTAPSSGEELSTASGGLGEVEQTLLDIALHEFEVRDFSEVRDESIIRFIPGLRKRLANAKGAAKVAPALPPLSALDPTVSRAPATIAPACYASSPPLLDIDDSPAASASVWPRYAPPSPPSPLVHLHIPKTGGTNFNLQLQALGRRLHHGGFCEVRTTDAHNKLPPAMVAALQGGAATGGAMLAGAWNAAVSRWRPSSNGVGNAAECSIVSGEFDASILGELWGLVKRGGGVLPTTNSSNQRRVLSAGAKRKGQLRAMTMLRDPISRTLSQFEHHISRDRFLKSHDADNSSSSVTASSTALDSGNENGRSRVLMQLVSPQLCPQIERRPAEQCERLTNPLKCRANGWCGVFQNHQSESLAGAMGLKPKQAQKLRRSGDQLLCAAKATLHNTNGQGLSFVGLMEHSHASMCLLLHTFKLGGNFFSQCCEAEDAPNRGSNCKLLAVKTTMNSANERNTHAPPKHRRMRSSPSPDSPSSSSSSSPPPLPPPPQSAPPSDEPTPKVSSTYIETYLEDEELLAALYDGNRIDCELYRSGARLLASRLRDMENQRSIRPGRFSGPVVKDEYSANCRRGAAAYLAQRRKRQAR